MARRRTERWVTASLVALAAAALAPRAANATEPKKASEPHMLSEPGEITNVIDAFDDENGDPFDVSIMLGYQQSWLGAKILRETSINQPGLSSGRFTANRLNVATYKEVTSRLNSRVDVGIFKDLALYLRMPLILSNTRNLDDLSGSATPVNQAVALQGAPGEQLFRLPFASPTRSGIEYLAVGVDWTPMNQARDATKPTWLIGFEGRFSVSEPMHACGPGGQGLNQKGTTQVQVDCADPSDINRDGIAGNGPVTDDNGKSLEGTSFNGARKPGVSRGTTAIEIHSLMSRRVKYVEPYGGFRALLEFANQSSDFGQHKGLDGVLTASPPLQGYMIVGMHVIPYEQRELFQRLTLDFRFTGSYRSEGRDYSPMFDALGSSDARSVRQPNFATYHGVPNPAPNSTGNISVVDPGSQKVYAAGLTDVSAHGTLGISTSVQFQAAEYIKFQVGMQYTHIQAHNITGDQPCNPNFSDNVEKSGSCHGTSSSTSGTSTTTKYSATGIPNPLYRPAYDIVGRRFFMDDANQWDAWIHAIVMFLDSSRPPSSGSFRRSPRRSSPPRLPCSGRP
jgi:hypothetical protein